MPDTATATRKADTNGSPAVAQKVETDLADHGKFAELASRRVSNALAAMDTVVKLGRTRGVAMTADDKAKVVAAFTAKLAELDSTWIPGKNSKPSSAAGFAL